MEKEKSFDSDGDVADFGARIFDANYPVFLSRDPLETTYPGHSTYIISNRNPIAFIDKGGKFGAEVHEEILQTAYTNIELKTNENVVTGVLRADDMHHGVAGFVFSYFKHNGTGQDIHFDGIVEYTNINNYWDKNIKSRLAQSALTEGVSGEIDFGMVIHTIQDFYSHTNYIELYIDYYYNKNGIPPEVTDIPTFQNAPTEFVEILIAAGDDFRSGDASEIDIIMFDFLLPRNNHRFTNKDNPESEQGAKIPYEEEQPKKKSSYFDYARATALKATVDVLTNGSLSQSPTNSSGSTSSNNNEGSPNSGGETTPSGEER